MGVSEVLQLAFAAMSGGVAQSVGRPLLRLVRGDADRERGEIERMAARVGDLEDLIDLLRKALDKHLIRESAIAAAAELMVNMMDQALDHVPNPPAALIRTRDRALDLLRAAREQVEKINREAI